MASKRLIDANALIERCKEIAGYEWNHKASPVSWTDAYEQFADDVEAEPTVEAVPVVHGRWEGIRDGWGRCSNCHRIDHIHKLATHCRFCGAKMDGGNEDGNL